MRIRCPFPPGLPEERCVHEGIMFYGIEGLVRLPVRYEIKADTTRLIGESTMAHLRSVEGLPDGTRFYDVEIAEQRLYSSEDSRPHA